MKRSLMILSLVLIFTLSIRADVYLLQQNQENGITTQGETWLGDGEIFVGGVQYSFIINRNSQKIIILNNKFHTYVETFLPLEVGNIVPEDIAGMVAGAQATSTVTVTSNQKKQLIVDWDAMGYELKIHIFNQEIDMTVWASSQVPFNWQQYIDLYAEIYKMATMTGNDFMEEFIKIKGFPLFIETIIDGQVSVSKVIKICEKIPPPGIYRIPSHYTQKDRFSNEELQ